MWRFESSICQTWPVSKGGSGMRLFCFIVLEPPIYQNPIGQKSTIAGIRSPNFIYSFGWDLRREKSSSASALFCLPRSTFIFSFMDRRFSRAQKFSLRFDGLRSRFWNEHNRTTFVAESAAQFAFKMLFIAVGKKLPVIDEKQKSWRRRTHLRRVKKFQAMPGGTRGLAAFDGVVERAI